jgi:tetratricopeptide (TPR) repeat protein
MADSPSPTIGAEAYYDLGGYARAITTTSAEAKRWFDRGLVWVYGFNMEEAQRCFRRAFEHDPACAMAYWGFAYARAPFYNKPWKYFSEADAAETIAVCHDMLLRAEALEKRLTAVERALIAAARRRFPQAGPALLEVRTRWEDDFAQAMRDVHRRFPADLDVATVTALALMTRTPWKLWELRAAVPAKGSDVIEAQRVLEAGLGEAERQGVRPHPGLAHAYIHCMEMSPTPEKALAAADSLRDYSRDCGHLHHMPCHIYAQCGLFHDAVVASEKAVAADQRYRAPPGSREFYILDRAHHLHLMAFAASMMGRYRDAREAAEAIGRVLTRPVLEAIENPFLARAMEGFLMHRLHVEVRFGRWQEIVQEPLPGDRDFYPVTTAMAHYARGIANAALGRHAAAEAERAAFHAACERVPADRFFHQNYARDILAVGGAMLEGEVAYHRGRHEEAFQHLRRAVMLDDALSYCEPWAWMHPPRHALGALLLEQGRVEEAAAAYRADLGLDGTLFRAKQNPSNVWSLTGYTECLERLGRAEEARVLRQQLTIAQSRVDTPVKASCCCRLSAYA